jgi:hypothetical protein
MDGWVAGYEGGWMDKWIGQRSIAINIYWAPCILVTDRKKNARGIRAPEVMQLASSGKCSGEHL